jgi:25S rRNA (cytosine2870-C5)-methyltransferase
VQDFDFDTDSGDDEAFDLSAKNQKSKTLGGPPNIIPTSSDSSPSEDSGSEDGGRKRNGKTTIANMEARSRAMDAEAAREAELDMQELQDAAAAGEVEDEDLEEMDGDEDEGGGPSEPVKILTSEEREAEKKAGGSDVITLQRRLRHCVRVLQNFKGLGKGRCDLLIRGLVLSLIVHSSYPGGEPTTYPS